MQFENWTETKSHGKKKTSSFFLLKSMESLIISNNEMVNMHRRLTMCHLLSLEGSHEAGAAVFIFLSIL